MSRASEKRLRAFAFDPKAQRLNVRAYAGGPLIAVTDVRALLERTEAAEREAEGLRRRIEVATGCIRRISTGTTFGAAGVLAALHALAPRATKDATLCGAGRKAKRR